MCQCQYQALSFGNFCDLAEQAFEAEFHNPCPADADWDCADDPRQREKDIVVFDMRFDAEIFADKIQAEDGYRLAGKAQDYGNKQRERFGAVEFDSSDNSANPYLPFDCEDERVFQEYRTQLSYFVHNNQNYHEQDNENENAKQ